MRVLVDLLLLVLATSLPASSTELFIRPLTPAICPREPCLTLDEYARAVETYSMKGAVFILLEGDHNLSVTLTLSNLSNISMKGEQRTRVIVQTDVSISFVDSQDILLDSLEIEHKGTTSLSDAALVIKHSRAVSLTNIRFTSSNVPDISSRGIISINSTMNIENCSFSGGGTDRGGALKITSSNVIFSGDNFFTNNTASVGGGAVFASDASTLVFNGISRFFYNRAVTANTGQTIGGGALLIAGLSSVEMSGVSKFEENGPIGEQFLAGGAIRVYGSSLNIQDRAFFARNSGSYAGAISALESNISLDGEMTFSDNRYAGAISLHQSYFTCHGDIIFVNNELLIFEGFGGGGLFSIGSFIVMSGDVRFLNNVAINGAGGALYAFNSSVTFSGNIEFHNNTANGGVGGAIYIDNSRLESRNNISFDKNEAVYRGGGVYAIDSTVILSELSRFRRNTAVEGGAMGFEGSAHLVIQSPLYMEIDGNRAESVGGGIVFVDSNTIAQCQNISIDKPNCFFKVVDNSTGAIIAATKSDIHLNFTENSANQAGTVLYGGALELCRVQFNDVQTTMDGYQFLRAISTFILDDENTSYISSDPLRVCNCNGGVPDCSDKITRTIRAIRGKMFTLPLIAVGQINMPVPSTIRAYIQDNDNVTELIPQSHMIGKECANAEFRLSAELENKILVLYPDGPCGNTLNTRKRINVAFDPCPPGFDLEGNTCICEKRILTLKSDTQCNVDHGTVERPKNTWMKPLWDENETYDGFLLHLNCPLKYCERTEVPLLIDFSRNRSDVQCSSNRTGTICGMCISNHSLTLKNLNCKLCGNEYISLTIFFLFSGIALVVILLGLQMTVATGTINGLILYANIVNANVVSFFPTQKVNVLTVFLSWLNLDFGIESCLLDGLDYYTYAWLQYAFPIYLFFLVGLIIISSRRSSKISKVFGKNPVAVLATITLMSYTKLLQNVIASLSFTRLYYPDGTVIRVWLYDGNIPYFGGKHVILAIAAISVFLLLLLPFTFLLLFGYHLQACSGKKMFFWFNKFKPMLDAYYAPYQKQTRYWIGLMLLVRGSLYLVFSFNDQGEDSANLVAILSVFTGIAVVPWLSYRIYEKFYNDVLEASFILNICLLSIATYHIRFESGNQEVATYLSIGVAFLEFLGIVCYHIFLQMREKAHFWKNFGSKYTEYLKKRRAGSHKKAPSKTDKTDSIFTKTIVELREPLLED